MWASGYWAKSYWAGRYWNPILGIIFNIDNLIQTQILDGVIISEIVSQAQKLATFILPIRLVKLFNLEC